MGRREAAVGVGLLLCAMFATAAMGARIVGGDGIVFNFPGIREADYCLVSDHKLHINTHMIGRTFESKPITWIGGLAIMFQDIHLLVRANSEAVWDPFVDHLEIRINGEALRMPAPGYKAGPHAKPGMWESPDKMLRISRRRVNEAHIRIADVLDLRLKADAVEEEWWTEESCFVHLDMEFRELQVSNDVHGILGQTYRSARVQAARARAQTNTEDVGAVDVAVLGSNKGPAIVGRMSDYFTSGLWTPDCKFSKFTFDKEEGDAEENDPADEVGLRGSKKVMTRRLSHRAAGQEEDVNPLEAYFSENAVRVIRRSKVTSESDDAEALQAFVEEEVEEESSPTSTDIRVVEISTPHHGSAIDGSDTDNLILEAPLEKLMNE